MRHKKFYFAIVFLIFIIAWIFLLRKVSPAEIVDFIGIRNGYFFSFLLSLLGSMLAVLPTPYYLIIITLGAGGLNPLFVGLSAGAGAILGDSALYFFGYSGGEIIPVSLKESFDKIFKWVSSKPYWFVATALFIYGAVIPLPNSVVTVPLGLARYGYKKIMVPLSFGNLVFNIVLAFIGFYGLKSIH